MTELPVLPKWTHWSVHTGEGRVYVDIRSGLCTLARAEALVGGDAEAALVRAARTAKECLDASIRARENDKKLQALAANFERRLNEARA